MKTKEEIDKEFDKLTPDSFVDDNSYYDEKEWLKNNEHLYTGTMYDEPAFTLDKEKVRIFIHSKLSQQKQEIVSGKFFNEITINEKVKIPKELLGYIEKEVRQKMINIIPGEIMDEDSDYYTGWNACIRTIREHLT